MLKTSRKETTEAMAALELSYEWEADGKEGDGEGEGERVEYVKEDPSGHQEEAGVVNKRLTPVKDPLGHQEDPSGHQEELDSLRRLLAQKVRPMTKPDD